MQKTLLTAAVCSLWVPAMLVAQSSTNSTDSQDSSGSSTQSSGSNSSSTYGGASGQSSTSGSQSTYGTSSGTQSSTYGGQSSTGATDRSSMMARFSQVVNACQEAQNNLDKANALARGSSTSSTTSPSSSASSATGTSDNTWGSTPPSSLDWSEFGRDLTAARDSLAQCNAGLAEMRSMHQGMRGTSGYNTDNSNTPGSMSGTTGSTSGSTSGTGSSTSGNPSGSSNPPQR